MPEQNNHIQNRNFSEIFALKGQYVIPFFQRGYVWGKRQWNQLHQDIESELFDEETGELNGREHFFGPIVVHGAMRGQPKHPDPNMMLYNVIDGQQRITTVYLMLAYLRRQLNGLKTRDPEAVGYSRKVAEWLENNGVDDVTYDVIKVHSVKGDRLATYYSVFEDGKNPQTPTLNEDMQMFNKNGNVYGLWDWMDKKFRKADAEKLWLWCRALTEGLKVVWIPLSEHDDPQAVFEGLNDKGTRLGASDLLCNYLFRPLIAAEANYESLHNVQWLPSQHKIEKWGHNFEDYLRNMLSIGESKAVGKERHMYVFFKRKYNKINERQARERLDDISHFVPLYGSIIGETPFDSQNLGIDRVLGTIKDTNMHSCRPFLLAALDAVQKGELEAAEAESLLKEVRTLLVRRKVADMRTTKYDSLFPPLLKNILRGQDKIAALHDQIRKAQLWVSNEEFKRGFEFHTMYHTSELDFARYVLREIDMQMTRESGSNQFLNYGITYTIEHVAPQTFTAEWLVETGCRSEEAYYSDVPLDTIGNLCLRSKELNSSSGQSSFAAKKKDFMMPNSGALAMDIAKRESPWNKEAIDKRSRDLAEYAQKIWAWSD